MSQNKRLRTNGLDDAQPGSSNTSQSTPDARALARSEQAKAQLSATDVKKLEVELARFLLFADKKNIPTKKQDIIKHVLKEHSRLLPSVLEGARKYLKQTFDYSVCEVDHNKNKYYILRNNIVLPELQQLTRPTHALSQLALLTIILSMIHMANNALDESDLWDTLKILGIDKSETHVDFGETEKLLNEFVKQMYIEKHKLTTSKGLVTHLKWGMRAYHESIPYILQGRHTVCHAETGCGKTFCYLIPLVNRLLTEGDTNPTEQARVQYLVFAPTPELGLQISNMFELIRPPELGRVKPHLWEGIEMGRSYIDRTSPLIITTFSKLRNYNYYELFGHVPTIVLDEADVYHTGRLKNVTYRILGELVDPFKYFKVSKQIPKPKQLVYVAATLNKFAKEGSGNNLRRWLEFHEMRPVMARSDRAHATPESLQTYWRKVDDEDFTRELVSAIESVYCDEDLLWEDSVPEEYSGLEDLGVRSQDIPIHIPEDLDVIQADVTYPDRKVLIFMNSAESVNVLYRNLINYLKQSPSKSVQDLARKVYRLSGSLTREERAAVMKRIGRGSIRILIASDVASRGIDIPGLDVVINAQLPVDTTAYLHRAGRTARMGNSGVVLNFLSEYDVPLYNQIRDVMKKKVPIFNETMVGPANPEKRRQKLDTTDVNNRKQNVDPWLHDNPSNFVSKLYRSEFEIE
ncbi:hypothetical protein ACHWQZ_G009044 [Mnemiopsis leidyi]